MPNRTTRRPIERRPASATNSELIEAIAAGDRIRSGLQGLRKAGVATGPAVAGPSGTIWPTPAEE